MIMSEFETYISQEFTIGEAGEIELSAYEGYASDRVSLPVASAVASATVAGVIDGLYALLSEA